LTDVGSFKPVIRISEVKIAAGVTVRDPAFEVAFPALLVAIARYWLFDNPVVAAVIVSVAVVAPL